MVPSVAHCWWVEASSDVSNDRVLVELNESSISRSYAEVDVGGLGRANMVGMVIKVGTCKNLLTKCLR